MYAPYEELELTLGSDRDFVLSTPWVRIRGQRGRATEQEMRSLSQRLHSGPTVDPAVSNFLSCFPDHAISYSLPRRHAADDLGVWNETGLFAMERAADGWSVEDLLAFCQVGQQYDPVTLYNRPQASPAARRVAG